MGPSFLFIWLWVQNADELRPLPWKGFPHPPDRLRLDEERLGRDSGDALAWVSVGIPTLRAANADPVKALRCK